jgi:hypothetical protein
LYSRLARHPEIRTVTMAEACAAPTTKLSTIFPGSWIDASFYIWIGHQDDQRAWSQLADAREALGAAASAPPPEFDQAKEEILIAEGSDWCWWYGDDHSSDHDTEFDDLFRRHLRNVYQFLQRPVPDELFLSNISAAGAAAQRDANPVGRITPQIDGEDTSYFEWLSAGRIEVRDVAGAMHQIETAPSAVTELRFGFDADHLYIRIDTAQAARDVLDRGDGLAVTFLEPGGYRVTLGRPTAGPDDGATGNVAVQWWTRPSTAEPWMEGSSDTLRASARTILELAVPLRLLKAEPAGRIAFIVTRNDAGGHEVERHPAVRPIELTVPDSWFDARHWSA